MLWHERLTRATASRKFAPDDVIAAFSRETCVAAEMGCDFDRYGLVVDCVAERLNERFGWFVIADRITDALLCYQALAERASQMRERRAA